MDIGLAKLALAPILRGEYFPYLGQKLPYMKELKYDKPNITDRS